jgi:hemerythrin superfamily protein
MYPSRPHGPHTMSLFVGGLFFGVIAARLLPPIAAIACGAMRVKAGRDPFDVLVADHRRFESLLTEMARAAQGSVAQRAQLFLRLKRRLAAHAMAEEDIVYPMLRNGPELEQHSRQLYAEHAEIKVLLFALEHSLNKQRDWSEAVTKLTDLILVHARLEEEREFPRLRESLSQAQRAMLAGNIAREKAMIL